ncbi:glycoside hydrolase [Nitrosomonas supralitoralis]|uniref:glycoside hydrolase n=1 Tax=Nitrosomonas supralitoralis TaxID=2116706 RepID=UPI001F5BC1B0|nr:glycoside hydrolase [Nitrosomonas supralitoralis]
MKSVYTNFKILIKVQNDIISSFKSSFPITAGQKQHSVGIVLVFTISMFLFSHNTIANPVKWHPGHYCTILGLGKNDPKYMSQVYNELKATPALRGIQIRYFWAELETAKGEYDFTSIDQRLAELAAIGKRLVIQVQTKSFIPKGKPTGKLVPDYLKANEYDGGEFAYSSHGSTELRGYNIALWNSHVQDRLVELFRVMGERYNSHPYFEGIGMIETAYGEPIVSQPGNLRVKFYDNLISVHQKMRSYFPNTMTIQEVNYPHSILASFVGRLKEIGTALSGPDVFKDEPGLNRNMRNAPRGIYHFYPELSGIIPLAPQVMHKNYMNTRNDGAGSVPTVAEIFAFARDNLKSNYIFWTRNPKYYSKVLELLNEPDIAKDPFGGLSSICPKAYMSCVD